MRSTRQICMNAMGIALFAALTMCLQVPVFENYYLCLGYVVMAVYCYSLGPVSGAVVGSMGVVVYCLLTSGLRGMPGWALGNLAIGLIIGNVFRATKKTGGALSRAVELFAVAAATAIGILVVKSGVECLLYAQPMVFRMMKNGYAFVADVVLLAVSLPVCVRLDGYMSKFSKEK